MQPVRGQNAFADELVKLSLAVTGICGRGGQVGKPWIDGAIGFHERMVADFREGITLAYSPNES